MIFLRTQMPKADDWAAFLMVADTAEQFVVDSSLRLNRQLNAAGLEDSSSEPRQVSATFFHYPKGQCYGETQDLA